MKALFTPSLELPTLNYFSGKDTLEFNAITASRHLNLNILSRSFIPQKHNINNFINK